MEQQCPGHSPFNVSYSPEVIAVLRTIAFYSNEVYGNSIIYLSPFNIAANVFSAVVLLTKDLRNPFNVLLSIMCLECAVPLLIRATNVYRQIIEGGVCTVETRTYSMALHDLIVYNSWAPFRAAYTWSTAFLTFLRYRALRSKGKWEASYSLVISGAALVSAIAASAGIPTYLTNIITLEPLYAACGIPETAENNATLVPRNRWSPTLYDNNCLIFYINQGVSGVFHNALPGLLLFVFTVLLAFEIGKARSGHNAVAARSSKRSDDAAKAARMLSVVAVLTLLSELPQGIVCLANIVLPIGFELNYSRLLTGLWLSIQNIATSCNLLIYLAMSRAFRKAVADLFCFWKKANTSSTQVSAISVSTAITSKK